MTTTLYKAGVDLDTLFKARASAKRADVGIKYLGVDLANRYDIRTSAAQANTGFRAAGVDLAQLFQDIAGSAITFDNLGLQSSSTAITATCALELRTTGDTFGTNINNTLVDLGDWLTPKSGMSGYSVKWTLTSGTTPAAPVAQNTFIALSATRAWTLSQVAVGIANSAFTVQFRHDASGALSNTYTVSMAAQRIS